MHPASEPALARTKDGMLHAVWTTAGPKPAILHAAFAADGKPAGDVTQIVGAWASLTAPRLVVLSDASLSVFFGGAKDTPPIQLHAATSKDGGKTWTVSPGASIANAPAQLDHLGAALNKDGKPVLAFAAGAKLLLRVGMEPGLEIETIRDGPCCVGRVQLAADGDSGEIWAAWRQSSPKAEGLYVRAVKPAIFAPPSLVPGSQSATEYSLSARVGAPGVYAAYLTGVPAGSEIKLWNVRGGEALTVVARSAARMVRLAPGPDGRLWIVWRGAGTSLSAIRSNKALTKFTRPLSIVGFAGAEPLAAEGSKGPLDVIASAGPAAPAHRRFNAQLQASAAGDGIAVLDLDDPVEGAEVNVEGKTLKTGANGIAAHTLPVGKPTQVKVTHPGYAVLEAVVTKPAAPAKKQ